jgi:hypothetical protein
MADREAPRVFASYAHDTLEHKDQVRRFATFLQGRIGLEVVLDQWADHERTDWSLWATANLRDADFILVIASPLYKARSEGLAPPDEGRGSQFETAIIRDKLTKDIRDGTKRVLPVVLPGRSIEEIPTFLNAYSTTRYEIEEFTREGVTDLLAAITGRGRHQAPRRGKWLDGDGPPPESVAAGELPWLGSSDGIHRGAAVIDGFRYEKSIVLRPSPRASRTPGYVEVDLGGHYQRLTAVVGVLDDAADPFQVGHFQVFLDGEPRTEHKVALGKPAAIDLDITGALRLRLEMSRPGTTASPFGSAVVVVTRRGGRPPELAWGNPTMT